jgi:hypothetical protein
MKYCPTCECPSPECALYCWRCDSALDGEASGLVATVAGEEAVAAVTAPEAAVGVAVAEDAEAMEPAVAEAASRRTCAACGYALQEDARFCNSCGASVSV